MRTLTLRPEVAAKWWFHLFWILQGFFNLSGLVQPLP